MEPAGQEVSADADVSSGEDSGGMMQRQQRIILKAKRPKGRMQVERVQTLTATAFTVGMRVKTQGSSRGDRREAWRRDKSRLETDNKRLKQRRGQESSRRRAADRCARRMQQLAVVACTVTNRALQAAKI